MFTQDKSFLQKNQSGLKGASGSFVGQKEFSIVGQNRSLSVLTIKGKNFSVVKSDRVFGTENKKLFGTQIRPINHKINNLSKT